MGLFDQLKNLAGQTGQNPLTQAAQSMENVGGSILHVGLPQELQNLQTTNTQLAQRLTELEAGLANGTIQPSELIFVRTDLQGHFGHLQAGGMPPPSSALIATEIKAHPLYATVKSNYAQLETHMHALEQKYLGCSFGYQLADGTVQAPTMDWTEDQWHTIQAQSRDQTSRCWLDADRSQYA